MEDSNENEIKIDSVYARKRNSFWEIGIENHLIIILFRHNFIEFAITTLSLVLEYKYRNLSVSYEILSLLLQIF